MPLLFIVFFWEKSFKTMGKKGERAFLGSWMEGGGNTVHQFQSSLLCSSISLLSPLFSSPLHLSCQRKRVGTEKGKKNRRRRERGPNADVELTVIFQGERGEERERKVDLVRMGRGREGEGKGRGGVGQWKIWLSSSERERGKEVGVFGIQE